MEVQIEFTFNASELGGKEVVTFEELYDTSNPDEPIKVAEHKDIKDEGQTVTVKEKPESPTTPEEPSTPTKTSDSPKTGDNTPFVALFVMMGISAAGLIFAGYKRFGRQGNRYCALHLGACLMESGYFLLRLPVTGLLPCGPVRLKKYRFPLRKGIFPICSTWGI